MESYSQLGQDLWVNETLNKSNGYFLDIGSHDGIYLSNTYLFEKELGWTGLCVDANPLIIEKLKNNRKCKCVNELIDNVEKDSYFYSVDIDDKSGVYSRVLTDEEYNSLLNKDNLSLKRMKSKKIDTILLENNVPKLIDYMSIDIEGKEFELLQNFPFDEYHVNVITVEHNEPHMGPKRRNKIREILLQNNFKFVKGNDDVLEWGHGPIEDFYINSVVMNNLSEDLSLDLSEDLSKDLSEDLSKDLSKKTVKEEKDKIEKNKIGILVKKYDNIFTCGISQQSYFTYKVLKNAGFEVDLITAENDYNSFEYVNIPIKKLTFQSDLSEYKLMIFVSSNVVQEKDLKFIKSFDIKIVNQVCGNYFYINQEDLVHDCFKRDFYLNCEYIDEYWILPMYDHMKSYLEVMTKSKVRIVNYVWDSDIIDMYMNLYNCKSFFDQSINIKNNLSVLIAEPNLSIHKTCLIPMCISDKFECTKDYNLEKVYLLCKNNNNMFNNLISKFSLVKNGKLELYNRIVLLDVLKQLTEKKIGTVLVSHQIKNNLNFLHLELMYLRYPIVHNCERMQVDGCFYNEHNVDEGFNALKYIHDNFDKNRQEIYNLYDDILFRFDPNNKKNINFYKHTINEIFDNIEIKIIKNKNVKKVVFSEQEKPVVNIKTQYNKSKNPYDNILSKYISDSSDSYNSSETNAFTNIYNNSNTQKSVWGINEGTVSGPGSTLENTGFLRYELMNIIRNYNIKSILDLGCGDFNWMNDVIKRNNKFIQKYLGVDIVENLIEKNLQYKNEKINFECKNILEFDDIYNNFDLIIVKEVLIHLSYEDALKFIKMIKKTSCKYLLITSFTRCKNKNIKNGSVYNTNLLEYPFNFPDPEYIINEKGTLGRFDNNLRDIPQFMYLYTIQNLPDF